MANVCHIPLDELLQGFPHVAPELVLTHHLHVKTDVYGASNLVRFLGHLMANDRLIQLAQGGLVHDPNDRITFEELAEGIRKLCGCRHFF